MSYARHADARALSSWQNIPTAGVLLTWTVWIAVRYKRIPLEMLMDRRWTGRQPKAAPLDRTECGMNKAAVAVAV